MRTAIACALLAALPFKAIAHGGHGDADQQGKTFTKHSEDTDLEQALKLCVSDQEKIQAFYSHGMALQYGFNFSEAIRAFYQAYQLDKGPAMPLSEFDGKCGAVRREAALRPKPVYSYR